MSSRMPTIQKFNFDLKNIINRIDIFGKFAYNKIIRIGLASFKLYL